MTYTWRTFRPPLRKIYRESWWKANGVDWRVEYLGYTKCSVCNRQVIEYLLHYENNQMLYICSDHGGEWFHCGTGEIVIQSTMPYWKRRIRNLLLTLKVKSLYFWYLIYDTYLWYIYWPIRYFYL